MQIETFFKVFQSCSFDSASKKTPSDSGYEFTIAQPAYAPVIAARPAEPKPAKTAPPTVSSSITSIA